MKSLVSCSTLKSIFSGHHSVETSFTGFTSISSSRLTFSLGEAISPFKRMFPFKIHSFNLVLENSSNKTEVALSSLKFIKSFETFFVVDIMNFF